MIDSVGALVSSEIAGIAGVIFVCDDMRYDMVNLEQEQAGVFFSFGERIAII